MEALRRDLNVLVALFVESLCVVSLLHPLGALCVLSTNNCFNILCIFNNGVFAFIYNVHLIISCISGHL